MLGVGAIGGCVGGRFALHGHGVTLIDFWSENIEAFVPCLARMGEDTTAQWSLLALFCHGDYDADVRDRMNN